MRDELIEPARNLDVALFCGVLIPQSGRAGRVTHAVHELRRRCAGRRRDRVRSVSKIVEVEVCGEIGDRGPGEFPVAVDSTLAQYLGAFTGEEVAIPTGPGEIREVVLELGNEERRECDGANAGIGLGSADHEFSVVELDLLLLNANGSVEEVDVSAFEPEEFTPAEAEEAGEEDQTPVSRWCGIGERPDLFDGRHRPFSGPLGTGALDNARVADDELVDDCGLEDCAQEPVALRNAVG